MASKNKLKSHSGAAKRFKKRASGAYKFRRALRGHILTKKSSKVKRQRRSQSDVDSTDTKRIDLMLAGR